jgi:curli biogenesis system outer membrane secretion channel CsgG
MFPSSLLALLAATGIGMPQGKPDAPQDPLRSLPPYYGPKKRVVVTAMEVKVQGVTTTAPTPSGSTTVVTLDIEQPTEFGTGLADMLTTALVGSKRFVVLERQNLEEVLRERALAGSPDADADSFASLAKVLGAQVIIRGAVTELALRKSGSAVGGVLGDTLGLSKSKTEAVVGIDMKLIDIGTGQVLDSIRTEGKVQSGSQAVTLTTKDLKLGQASFNNSPLGKAVRQAIDDAVLKICQKMEPIPWEARIAEIVEEEGGKLTLYVNAGKDSGLKVGDVLEVLRLGAEIKDPDTHLVIGRTQPKKLGRIKVEQIEDKLTLCAVLDAEGYQKGDTVRLTK